jgi:hypothetical protein
VKHHSDLGSPDAALGRLQGGRFVRSDVEPETDGVPWYGRPVFLIPGDEYCDECRDLIAPGDSYGPGWVNVLARQKLKYSGTWCGDCFAARGPEQEEPDDESERAGRTFG